MSILRNDRVSRHSAGLTTLVLLIIVPLPARAAPPQQLLGKTLIISWSETRVQRPLGAQEMRTNIVASTVSIYIGTSGRHFIREVRTSVGGRRPRQGTFERAPGDPALRG